MNYLFIEIIYIKDSISLVAEFDMCQNGKMKMRGVKSLLRDSLSKIQSPALADLQMTPIIFFSNLKLVYDMENRGYSGLGRVVSRNRGLP
jgi:hypothetical protein